MHDRVAHGALSPPLEYAHQPPDSRLVRGKPAALSHPYEKDFKAFEALAGAVRELPNGLRTPVSDRDRSRGAAWRRLLTQAYPRARDL